MKHIGTLGSILLLILLASCTGDEKDVMQNTNTPAVIEEGRVMEGADTGSWSEEQMETMRQGDSMENKASTGTMMEDETMMGSEDTDMKDNSKTMMQPDTAMMQAGSYVAYSPELVGKNDHTVLFFHANWCPSCRAADAGITSGTIPAGLTILKADFDSETALKKLYGVTSQHTFVEVDAQGNLIKKWVGGTTVEDIVEKI